MLLYISKIVFKKHREFDLQVSKPVTHWQGFFEVYYVRLAQRLATRQLVLLVHVVT